MASLAAARLTGAGSTLEDRLTPLRDAAIEVWHATRAVRPAIGPTVSRWRQWQNAGATGRLIDDIAGHVDEYPREGAARAAWREALRVRLQQFGEQRLGWPASYRRLLLGDAFYESTVAFTRQAHAFDPTVRLDDLWQALRNVWIGNNLQMLLGRPVRLTPGLFAYSMLYPVTDNLLDAPDVSASDKRQFTARLGRRLVGEPVRPEQPVEASAFDLVARIEDEFPRHGHPDVWDSVLAIHRGQVASLSQHRGPMPRRSLLEISVAKGGASVLADVYLVAGDITPAQERFAFDYGVFLQLLDDLQDVGADLAAGHETLFTQAAREGHVDHLTVRLLQFIDVSLDAESVFTGAHTRECLDLIRRNCQSMLAGVMAENPAYFSGALRRAVEGQWPLTFAAMRRLRRRAQGRFRISAQRLQARYGVSSPLDLILSDS